MTMTKMMMTMVKMMIHTMMMRMTRKRTLLFNATPVAMVRSCLGNHEADKNAGVH
jgi:hypothetical protein